MWLNAATRWTWIRLWQVEQRFWSAAPGALADAECGAVLAQAARELLLLQSSDWQFILSTGAAGDYATQRFNGHAEALASLLEALEPGGRGSLPAAQERAESLRRRDDVFPGILPVLATVLRGEAAPIAR
jgi:1,4-alpha-glucan branching enzyme